MDLWYYMAGSQPAGPVPAAEIVRMVQSGMLNPATAVARAGAPDWAPASVALAQFLTPAHVPEPPAYAVKVEGISGPDTGKAFMIGAPEVSLGRVSGLGINDASVAENHIALSWQNNLLHFRTFEGCTVRVAGMPMTKGTLANGQQFQLGGSTWQVGTAPVELTSLLGSLGSRLNRLASTDKLEGFSLGAMFSEVFQKRKTGELDTFFVVGTPQTTPALQEVRTGWPKPWFFMRVFIFLAAVYACLYITFTQFGNPRIVPGLIFMGSMVVPLSTVFLFWEMNTPRNVSFHMVLMLVSLGGVISLFVSLLGFGLAHLEWLGAASAGIVEETGKLAAVILVVRGGPRYRWILNGIVFGAAIGGGFSAFETAGYTFNDGFFNNFVRFILDNPNHDSLQDLLNHGQGFGYNEMLSLLMIRSLLAPFGHMLWTAISAGALWRVMDGRHFNAKMLVDPKFFRTFLIPVGLHMLWNSPLILDGWIGTAEHLGLGVIGWYVAFTLIQQGLRQVREAQLADTRTEFQKTQMILTTTGRFRRQMI
jgi:RsiW-degrading membrane proteinase PrsW (M82 family)